ncbi:MAG: TlpA family protein disulfide reductase [Deltaproteobacteria bacterium]|nr:TlpA family protein disulfide reductase [Deltaproteobacteria bacterium]
MRRLLGAALVGGLLLVAPWPGGAGTTNFTVRDLNGRYLRLSDYDKNVVLMSFWTTWCKPCLVELRHLDKFYRKYKDKGFVVLGVAMDGPETQAKVSPTVRSYRLGFPVFIDTDSQVVKLYNTKRAQPFSVLIKGGKVVKTRAAFQLSDLPEIEREIQALLK